MTPSTSPPVPVQEDAAPLRGVRVADLSESVAGQFAARLLADQGASVTLVEPAGGSVLRRSGPYSAPSGATTEESLLFRHLNAGKSSRRAGGDRLDELADLWRPEEAPQREVVADVIVTSDRSTEVTIGTAFPDAWVATVSDFAADGPYAGWTGSELIHQALSGSMYYNGRGDQQPLYGTGHRASYAAGFLLYTRIVSELYAWFLGRRTARHLQVSVHEVAASMEQNFSTQWAYSRTVPQRGEWNRPKGRVACLDGWMVFFAAQDRRRELFRAFGAEDAADDPRFAEWPDFVRNISSACALFTTRSRDRSQQQILDDALRDRLILSPVRRLGDLHREDHLRVRDYWRHTSEEPRGRLLLGPVWRPLRRGAPGAGPPPTHPVTTPSAGPAPVAGWVTDAGRVGPLEGVRVTDLTSAWSGPMATRLLAALGAEVIKVEGVTRMDGWRGHRTAPTHLESYPSASPGRRPFDRNAWFNTQNPGKRSIAIDLKDERGRAVALDLAAVSDLVIANFSPGTLDRLGLGLGPLEAVNAGVAVVEMSGFGDTGPLRDHRGLGQTMEAMSGITSLIGYPEDGEPLGSGSAYLDPMGGVAGAAAAVTCLLHAHRSRRAQRVEVPQREAAMQWIGELVLDAAENSAEHHPRGNDVTEAVPHDAFPARGTDQWIAVAVFTEEQWVALCRVCDWTPWGQDPSLRTLAGRRARLDDIARALTVVTQDRDKADLARELQRAGVPAAPVQDGRDLYGDPQLRARGWFTCLAHAEVGDCDYPGVAVEVAGRLVRPRRAAPRFAEHTAEVMHRLLGRDTDAVDALVRAGVVSCAGPPCQTDPPPGPPVTGPGDAVTAVTAVTADSLVPPTSEPTLMETPALLRTPGRSDTSARPDTPTTANDVDLEGHR